MTIRREFIGTTANERVVSAEMERSHFATHVKEQPGLRGLAREALEQIDLTQDDVALQVDMKREVGHIDLVEIEDNERVIYGKRRNRDSYIPFVDRDGERPLTNFVVMVLRKLAYSRLRRESPEPRLLMPDMLKRHQHDLFSAYVGIKTPGLPGGNPKYVTEESVPFWTRHALVLGSQEVDEFYNGVPPEFRR